MDLRLFGQVLWRFRVILAIGFVLAILLAGLAMVRVQFDNGVRLTYRQNQVYQSDVTVLVNSNRFIQGYGNLPPESVDTPGWLSELAVWYANQVQGDAVQRKIPAGGYDRLVTAAPATDASGRNTYPWITVSGASTSASDAVRTAQRGAEILINYARTLQNSAAIPGDERVTLTILRNAGPPTVIEPRKKTVPIFIFLVVMIATVGLILVMENMRPHAPTQTAVPLRGDTGAGAADPEKKKSAGSGDAS